MIIKVQDVLYVSFDFNEIDDNIIVSYDGNNNTLFQTEFHKIEKFYNLTSDKFIKKTNKSIYLLTKISKDSSLYNLVSLLDNKIELLNKNNNKINKMLKTNNNDIYIKFKISKDKTIVFNDEKLVKIKEITDFYKILNLGCSYRIMFNIEFYNYNDNIGFIFKVKKLQIKNNQKSVLDEINNIDFTD